MTEKIEALIRGHKDKVAEEMMTGPDAEDGEGDDM